MTKGMGAVLLGVALLALFAVPSYAQLPRVVEALENPQVVAGAGYMTEDPGAGVSRVKFLLTANVAGIRPLANVPLYVGGVGVDLRTLDPVLGSVTGVGISIPILTYAIKEGQFVAQVGWAHDLEGTAKSGNVYAGFGFSLQKPAVMQAKRVAKKAGKKYGCGPS